MEQNTKRTGLMNWVVLLGAADPGAMLLMARYAEFGGGGHGNDPDGLPGCWWLC